MPSDSASTVRHWQFCGSAHHLDAPLHRRLEGLSRRDEVPVGADGVQVEKVAWLLPAGCQCIAHSFALSGARNSYR
jgi:hypothetical protein